MQLIYQGSETGLQVLLVRGLGSERDSAEREVLEAGVALPLSHRAVWVTNLQHSESLFLLVRDASGRACGGVAIEKVATRALPGHVILRVGKFGGSLPAAVCQAQISAIAILARSIPRVLRVELNMFSRKGFEAFAETLKDLGFREARPPSSYRHTLVIDLRPSEEEIFAAFGKSARKRIRETMKMSLKSIAIGDPVYAGRLLELQQEALRRTGGHIDPVSWKGILKLSADHPGLSRVFGLFPSEDLAPENMGAFAWVCNHGDHAEYCLAGSKSRGEVRIPFGYLLVWDMVRWAKAVGAEWFDMGGVTVAGGDETSLEGISEFKRYFSHAIEEVGAEWQLEPVPVRARIAAMVSNSARGMQRLILQRPLGWAVSSGPHRIAFDTSARSCILTREIKFGSPREFRGQPCLLLPLLISDRTRAG